MSTFESQVQEFLIKRPSRWDVIVEDTWSISVSRWKDIWIKVPKEGEEEDNKEGYLKAFAFGYIDNLWIEGVNIITPHVEGRRVYPIHKQLLEELWETMVSSNFFLEDWHLGNIIYSHNSLKVIDWGDWTHDAEKARIEFEFFLEYYLDL